jgi:hypothetical protein
MRHPIAHFFGLLLFWAPGLAPAQTPGLRVALVAQPPTQQVVIGYDAADKGPGNTSLAFDGEDVFKWSQPGAAKTESFGYYTPEGREVPYIKRDRDLGQTFTYQGEQPRVLRAITVQLGFGTNAVRPGMYGQKISLQLLEVSGTPRLHQNGSDSTMEAFHGFPHDRAGEHLAHMRDDYLVGEKYRSRYVFTGATFPRKTDFGFAEAEEVPPGHPQLKGRYLRFELPEAPALVLQPGKTYAFLVMVEEQGPHRGFALANQYYGTYPGGHGIRRDGNGQFPPVPADPTRLFAHPANRAALRAAHFPTDLKKRAKIAPGTNGYPDVDTWRDLVFYVEGR